jgi:ankyrin repeat protein
LAHGADLHATDQSRAGVLEYAVRGDSVTVLAALIDLGVQVNGADDEGRTPLMAAVESDNLDAVKLLIENGAAVDMSDAEGRDALARIGPVNSGPLAERLGECLSQEQSLAMIKRR